MKKKLPLLLVFLISCSSLQTIECVDCEKAPTTLLIPNTHNTIKLDGNQEKELNTISEENIVIVPVANIHRNFEQNSATFNNQWKIENNDSIANLLDSLSLKAKEKWGNEEYIQSSKHRYVKYLNSYTTRADIQFDLGKITVSSLSPEDRKQKIRNAIVQVLLMPQDPEKIDLFGTSKIPVQDRKDDLLFLGQILDQDEKPIEWEWRATRFANYLVENKLKSKNSPKGTIDFVEIEMVENHIELRKKIYTQNIQSAARQYDISESLINAIIKTESSFNPFSVSHGGALGLMQIVPATAGADVFKLVKKSNQLPSTSYFLNPKNNIDVGSAYLNILYHKYLAKLTNPTSKYFAMISAYNSGAGGVLSTFDLDKKKAIEQINQNNPKEVYNLLITQHPREEARAYLQKVVSLQKNFNLNDV